MSLETQAAIVAWYVDQMATLRDQVVVAQQQALAQANGDYSDEAAAAYAAAVIPAMAGAQAVAAQLTAAYLAYMVADMTGKALSSVVPPTVDLSKVTGPALRNGLSQDALYRRPFSQARNELAKPSAPAVPSAPTAGAPAPSSPNQPSVPARNPQNDAASASERRAQTIGLTDLELATTHAAQDALSGDKSVVGYRRVLTGAENCGMCVVASTKLYRTADLMPMHPNCDCVVAPVTAGEDPGRTINNRTVGADLVPEAFNKHGVPIFKDDQTIDLGDMLQATHDAINERFGASFANAKSIDYRKAITIRQHGELGPILTVARHKFTKRQLRDNDLRA